MTFHCEDDETNRLVAVTDNIEVIVKIQPQPSPEALGPDEPPTNKAAKGTKGMAPPEGSKGESAFCQGSPPDISEVERKYIKQ